jgi:hypothetical protein
VCQTLLLSFEDKAASSVYEGSRLSIIMIGINLKYYRLGTKTLISDQHKFGPNSDQEHVFSQCLKQGSFKLMSAFNYLISKIEIEFLDKVGCIT